MNEQTKKLREKLAQWLYRRDHSYDSWRATTTLAKGCYRKLAEQILKTCKEAGLIFKHDCQNCPKREEDAYGPLCVLTCAEPFEEIDIECMG